MENTGLKLATVVIEDREDGTSKLVVNGMDLSLQATKAIYEHVGESRVPLVTITLACDEVYIQTPLGQVAFRDGTSRDGSLRHGLPTDR